MSSHHIVKEKQEPALYIHCLGNFDEEYLGQLLEWSPTLLVAASQYEKVLSLGIKVDVVIGPNNNQNSQENTKFIAAKISPLTTAINYLITQKYPAVKVIGKTNSFDDLICFLPQINLVLFNQNQKSYPIKNGFKIWKPAGTIFKIKSSNSFNTCNLTPKEDGFIVINDGFVTFNFTNNYLFLTEML